MPVATVADFIDALQKLPILEPAQRSELANLAEQFPDLNALAQVLVRRSWLTSYQAELLTDARGQELILDQYVVLELLGQGGMGTVYKARQIRMNRLVAVKVIRPENLTLAGAVERFRREAQATARVNHVNIVTVFDSGEAHGIHYLTMEYIEGTDLGKLVKPKRPLPVDRACDYIRQAALGLQEAHAAGLVHRDIKPSNLMLTQRGVVKVMDLGLARIAQGSASGELTYSGAVMGTPDYIAPEQTQNSKTVDIRADIYSLGCSLYYLLTGQPPFPEPEAAMIKMYKHFQEEPAAVESLRPDLPAEVAEVVRRMMKKKPEQRYQTPGEVARALAPFGPPAGSNAHKEWGAATPPVVAVTPEGALLPETVDVQVRSTPPTRVAPLSLRTIRQRSRRRLVLVFACLAGLLSVIALIWSYSSTVDLHDTRQQTGPPPSASPASPDKPTSAEARDTRLFPMPTTKPALPTVSTKQESRPKPQLLPGKEYLTNAIGMQLVKIPAGKFTMGSPLNELDRGSDEDQHEVAITRPFWMGVYEVTQEQYQKVTGTNPSYFSTTSGGKDKVQDLDVRWFPMDQVSWDGALAFCRKLSELPEEQQAGRSYRLPTEAEWEYACRAGASAYQVFHFGNSLSSTQANFKGGYPYGDAAQGPFLGRTCTVGSYQANAFGLYDMHGNVREWCQDWYGPYAKEFQQDPQGPATGIKRVVRGGSWHYGGNNCRAGARNSYVPNDRSNSVGFRVVLGSQSP